MGPYEYISLVILMALQIAGIGFTFWSLSRSSEKNAVVSMLVEKDGPVEGEISFSRVAGVLGALSLASLFIANVFWVQHQLFNGGDLSAITERWPIYVFGTALFAPYAFNRLARFGRNSTPENGQ